MTVLCQYCTISSLTPTPCGLAVVWSQRCPPSTVTLSPTPVESCYTQQLLYSTVCTLQYRKSVLNALSRQEGCRNYSTHFTEFSFCASNTLGTYCEAILNYNFTAASRSCRNTSTCDPLCIETLNNITNTVGCCFNYRFNSTGNPSWDWLSAEFWSMCNLDSPGFCELRLVNDTLTPLSAETQQGNMHMFIHITW